MAVHKCASHAPELDPFSAVGIKEVFNQVFIGVMMGLILQVVNAALVVGGQAISASMGYHSFALEPPIFFAHRAGLGHHLIKPSNFH